MEFREVCKDKSISPSYTRMRIFDFLQESKSHPTVDEIYTNLKPELPTLSKTTVYNVLNLFIEKEIADSVNLSPTEARYELVINKHSHFKCEVCNTIYDIPYIKPQINTESLEGFIVEKDEVTLKGICSKCATKSAD